MTKFCSECGFQLHDSAKFCPECGTPCLTEQAPAPQTTTQPTPQPVPQHVPAAPTAPRDDPYPKYAAPLNAQPQQPAYAQPDQYSKPQQPAYAQPDQYAPPQQYAAPYGAPQGGFAPAPPAPKKSKTGLIITLSVVAALLIAGVVLFIIFKPFGGGSGSGTANSPEEVLDTMIESSYTDKISSDRFLSIIFEYSFFKDQEDKQELRELVTDNLDDPDFIKGFKDRYGDDFIVTGKITDSETLTGEDLQEVKEAYAKTCDVSSIEEIREVTIHMTIEGSKDSAEQNLYAYFFKADGKWYVEKDII